ncbi:zinc finger protein 93-like isoform X2 [Cloeon dipterum]|uniref:zinc finger protein 93-like isoform X2 n=1 Tax=Cloeon dipterum TaxID=197152 RepID=UPI00321FD87F
MTELVPLTLREIAENVIHHPKLTKMKIAIEDNSQYKFYALVDDTSYIMWGCAASKDCRSMVATDFDGLLVNKINCHSAFCPESAVQKRKQDAGDTLTATTTVNGVKMKEVLVPYELLTSKELKTGILGPSTKNRVVVPVSQRMNLPDSIPKVYEKGAIGKGKKRQANKTPTLSQYCRMCGTVHENMTLVRGYDGTNREMKFKLEWLLSKNIPEDDKLPMKLCETCLKNLNSAYEIFVTAMKTQEFLKKLAADQGIKLQLKEEPKKRMFPMLIEEQSLAPVGIKCSLCDEIDIVDIRKHNLVFHSEFLCRICHESFENALDLKEHTDEKHLRACQFCSCSFDTQKGYELHLRSHEICKTPGMKFVPCQYCKETFHDKHELQVHYCKVHLQEIINKKTSDGQENTYDVEQKCEQAGLKIRQINNYDLFCKVCEEKCPSTLHLTNHHRQVHKTYFCDKCKDTFTECESIIQHIQIIHDQSAVVCQVCDEVFRSEITFENHKKAFHMPQCTFPCPVCERMFFTTGKLRRHMRLHLSEEDHQCPTCGKMFSNKSSYLHHLRLHDDKREDLSCNHCDRKFKTKKYLIMHIKSHHISAWYYRCLDCGKESSSIEDITIHCSIHPGERRIQRLSSAVCRFCNKEFASSVILDRHIYNAHRNKKVVKREAEEPINKKDKLKKKGKPRRQICRECDKVFPTKSELILHKENFHGMKKFSCKICKDKHYIYEALLRQHELKMHQVLHEFRCSVCESTFNTSTKLNQHIAISHSQDNDEHNVCQYCDKAFLNRLNLMQHLATHREEEDAAAAQYVTITHHDGNGENIIKIALEGIENL